MNKVITVNVFQSITVYLLRLFMGAGSGLRRRKAKVHFATVEYETIKDALCGFLLSQTSFFFFLPFPALTSWQEVMGPPVRVD